MVTIKDVAKATGVSPSTVSRVIADNPRISAETKKKVRKAMKELGYHPNINARNLVAKYRKQLGWSCLPLPINHYKTHFFLNLARIGSITHKMRYSMTLSSGEETEDEIFAEVERMVYGSYVRRHYFPYIREWMIESRTFCEKRASPFVMVGKPSEYINEITHVDNDNFSAGKEITTYLIQEGHKRMPLLVVQEI